MSAEDVARHLGPFLDALADLLAEKVAAKGLASAQPPPSPLVTKQGLATALGVSATQVDRLVRTGRVPFFNVGDTKRFDVAEVREALRLSKPGLRKAEPEPEPENLDALVRYGRARRGTS